MSSATISSGSPKTSVPEVSDLDPHNASSTLSDPKVYPATFYTDFLSKAAASHPPSPFLSLETLENAPGMISLLAGNPNPALFPITAISFTIRSPTGDGNFEKRIEIKGSDLEEALQYGATAGLPKMITWFKGLQVAAHHRPIGPDWELSIGSGSQDLICKSVFALVNPGDPVLVEAPVYAGVVPLLLAQQADCIEIATDEHGVIASSMRSVLENWPANKPRPKLFYTVPYGCNPSGVTTALERRLEIMALAHEYNFLIMEDDPYYYLYFGSDPRPPSYWELEGKLNKPRGRVLRFDSFSKILSSGLRLGLVTGPKPIVDAINSRTSSTNLQVSSTTQAIAYAFLSDWGYDTFIQHTHRVADFYRQKRDVFAKALDQHLKGLAEWAVPEAGMFFWIKLILPPTEKAPDGDSFQVIAEKALEACILALPGKSFFVLGRATPYVRLSFSLLDEAEVNEGLRRLAEVIKSCQH